MNINRFYGRKYKNVQNVTILKNIRGILVDNLQIMPDLLVKFLKEFEIT